MRFKEQTLLAGLCILAKVLQHWRNELPSIKAQSSEVTSIPLALAHINLLKHGIFTSLYGVLVSCLLEEMGTREGREKKGGFRFAEEMLFLQIWKFRSLGFVPSLSHFNERLLTAFVLFAWKFSIYQKLLGHKRCTGTQRNCQPWTPGAPAPAPLSSQQSLSLPQFPPVYNGDNNSFLIIFPLSLRWILASPQLLNW